MVFRAGLRDHARGNEGCRETLGKRKNHAVLLGKPFGHCFIKYLL